MRTKSFSTYFPLVIFISIAVVLWYGIGKDPKKLPSTLIGKPAPAFALPSLYQPQQLFTQKLFEGKISLLHVWASWCPTCAQEFPYLMDITQNASGVLLYGLDYKDDPTAAKAWLKEKGNPFQKVLNDRQGKVAIDYGVYGTPETFLIDQEGVIRYKYVGAITRDVWENRLLPHIRKLKAH